MSASTALEHHEEQSDRQLWAAVLSTAIEDATTLRTSKQAERDKQVALEWLLTDSKDFRSVCWMAGVDPEAVRDRLMRMLRPGVVGKFQKSPSDRTFPSTQEISKLEFSRP